MQDIQSIFYRSLGMSRVDKVKLAEEEKEAIDEGMKTTNSKTRAAEAMTPATKQELEATEAGRKILNLHDKQMKDLATHEQPMGLGSNALSSFLALPTELHLQIILNLAHSIESGLLKLREVNRHFRSIIFSSDLHTWGITLLEHKQFKAADHLYGFMRIEDHLPCTLCQRLLPKDHFHMQAKQGKKALGHKLGHTRFCMDCGIQYRKFGGGNSVKVDDQTDHYRVVCSECFSFLDGPEGVTNCDIHYWRSENDKQRLKLLRLRGSGPSN